MSRTFSRRALFALGAGSVASLAPTLGSPTAQATPNQVQKAGAGSIPPGGQLITLQSPVRVFDTRTDPVPLGLKKLSAGQSVAVTVGGVFADLPSGYALSVFINCTVTQTEGVGYLVVRGSDLSGEVPLPPTSNVNWTGPNQTIANMALSAVGGENALEVHCARGATHFIVDVFGYVPYLL